MVTSDDEHWPDPDVFTTGRDKIDHLRQLREKWILQETLEADMHRRTLDAILR